MRDESFTVFVQDQLRLLGGVECRAMFGGHSRAERALSGPMMVGDG